MCNVVRTAITAAVSCLLTLSLVAGCELARPEAGLGPGPTEPPARKAPPPAAGQPGGPPGQVASSAPVAKAQPAPAGQSNEAVIRVYRDASPTVVNVISTVVTRDFFNQVAPRQAGAGSGFIADEQGHIVTNNHVVEDADRLEVTLEDARTVPARLVGRDPRADLAVIQVDVPRDQLKVARLGDSSQVQIGEMAIAIGNPFGLERTVTAGIVSGRRAVVEEPGGAPIPGQQGAVPGLLINAIQTDASINPGNSGGPLFNARGEVIGINTLILSPGAQGGLGGNIGIGFAIPIDYAKRIVPELIAKGRYAHPFMGVSTQEITEIIAREANLPVREGLLVAQVDPGTPAARAGLRGGTRGQDARSRRVSLGGDIITAIDGQPLRRPEQLLVYLETQKSVGDTVTLSVARDGQTLQVQVQLAERPAR
jgi:S1-C subfamily serine protease